MGLHGLRGKKQKLTTELTKSCRKCGSADRYVSGDCKACARAYEKARWPTIRDKHNADKRARYAADVDGSRAYYAVWRAKNPEKVKASIAEWEAAHPNNKRLRSGARRARIAGGKLSLGLVDHLMEVQSGRCACCYVDLTNGFHLDHRMPLALGGLHADENMQLLCPPCNLSKGGKHPDDFVPKKIHPWATYGEMK